MDDLVVPGLGTVAEVLSIILQLCGEMKECQDPTTRVHLRLKAVSEDLMKLEKNTKKKKRLPPPEALDKYVAVIVKTLRYLEHYQGKKLLFRLMKHRVVMAELRLINEEIDVVIRALGLPSTDTLSNWKQQFEVDRQTHRDLLAATMDNAQEVLAELQDARPQQETMLTLKYEVEGQQDAEMVKLLKSMMATVVRTSMTSVPKLPPWFLPPYEIRFDTKPFARGSFATAHRGLRGSGTNVVVKCFIVSGVEVDDRTRQHIEAEMNLWYQFDHPNVIKLLGASHISMPPFIVCEDATNGDLRSFLARSDANNRQLWKLLYQAALGLEYIHEKSVVHGDLKLNNILVGANGQAKLSDFGSSAVRTSAILSENVGETPYNAGALRWRAPECLKRSPTFSSDVYSFGMCIIEAVNGEPPFAFFDDDSVHEKLRNGEIPDKPEKMSAEAWELVLAMTHADPAKRISLPAVIKTLQAFADKNPKSSPLQASKAVKKLEAELPENANTAMKLPKPALGVDIIADILTNVLGMDDQTQEQSMLKLVRLCIKDEDRPRMYEANAVQILTDLVKSGCTYYTKLYALQCLKWSVMVDANMPKNEFDSLRDSVSDVPVEELASVANILAHGTDQEKEEAVVRCACIANGRILRDAAFLQSLAALWQGVSKPQTLWVGMVQPLVLLLQSGNDIHKVWAVETIGCLAIENEALRAEIMRADAITPLVDLLRAGTEVQRHRASNALRNLAFQVGVSEVIALKGAVAPLLGLVLLGTTQQKQTTTALLESLVLPSHPNREDIEREASISSLVAMSFVGSEQQKEAATAVLINLANNVQARNEIVCTGVISFFVGLLRTGTNAQKYYAAGALANLANNDMIGDEIARCKGVSPLVELLRTGTKQQKDCAMEVLKNLALSDEIRTEIVRDGGVELLLKLIKTGTDPQRERAIAVLVNLSPNDKVRCEILSKKGVSDLLELLRTGSDEQSEMIAGALGNLADSDEGRTEIARQGGIPPLVTLLRTGSWRQKGYAADMIGNLAQTDNKIRSQLVRAGSVPLLRRMSRRGSEEEKASAARALQQLNGDRCILM